MAKNVSYGSVLYGEEDSETRRTQQEQEDQERILSIKKYGGRHLQNFKTENRTYPVCLAAVTDDGTALEFVPEKLRTKEIYEAACKSSGAMLQNVPENHISASLCKAAVMNDGLALSFVPEKYKTEKLCLAAVKNNPRAISNVPSQLVTPEFCVKADCLSSVPNQFRNAEFYDKVIDLNPKAFLAVPKQYRTAAICKKYFAAKKYKSTDDAIRHDKRLMGLIHPSLYDHETSLLIVQSYDFRHYATTYGTIFITNPMELSTGSIQLKKLLQYPDVFLIAFELNPGMIEYAPEKILTSNLLMTLLEKDKRVLMKIPEKLRTKELCEKAFKLDPWALSDIPDEFKTPDMCMKAVKESGFNLQHVPDSLKTLEMCKIAVADEGHGTPYVPAGLYDKALALLVLKNPGSIVYPLKSIPEQFIDYDMCRYAVLKDGNNLGDVPDKYKDYDLCLSAVKQTPHAARFIPAQFFTPEVVLATVKNTYCFRHIPKDKLTEEACLEYISKAALTIENRQFVEIPRSVLNQNICNYAFQKNAYNINGIPYDYITEDMLLAVAVKYPYWLGDNIPPCYRNNDFYNMLIEVNPGVKPYLPEL